MTERYCLNCRHHRQDWELTGVGVAVGQHECAHPEMIEDDRLYGGRRRPECTNALARCDLKHWEAKPKEPKPDPAPDAKPGFFSRLWGKAT